MKVILAGSKDIRESEPLLSAIQAAGFFIGEVLTGNEEGINHSAIKWARSNNIPLRIYAPDWNNITHPQATLRTSRNGSPYNAAAASIRNEQLIQSADAAIIVTNGSLDTDDLIQKARGASLPLYVHQIAPPIRGLSLYRPWPYAIFYAGKDIENRPYPAIIGQWLAIHATPAWDADSVEFVSRFTILPPKRFHVAGAIMGVARVSRIITMDDEESDSPWFFGPYGWKLDNVTPFKEPIRASGKRKLWELTPEQIKAIRIAYKEAKDAM